MIYEKGTEKKEISIKIKTLVIDEENPITAEDPVILGERCWVERKQTISGAKKH